MLAGVGYLVAIPRAGAAGAAPATLAGATLVGLTLVAVVQRVCQVRLSGATVLRCGLVSTAAYAAAALWPATGAMVVVELAAISAGIVIVLRVAGELGR